MTILSFVVSSLELSSVLCHMHLNWVSMSTRQIGQCLLVTSHWSTQSRWNKCMQGSRLKNELKLNKFTKVRLSVNNYRTSLSISNCERQIVHFSLSSSASLARRSFLYLWGKVWVSIVSCVVKILVHKFYRKICQRGLFTNDVTFCVEPLILHPMFSSIFSAFLLFLKFLTP